MSSKPKETKTKNRGELAEIYVFLKLLLEGKIQLTDEARGTVRQAFLEIVSIIREEKEGEVYRYLPVNQEGKVRIKLNNTIVEEIPKSEFLKWLRLVSEGMFHAGTGGVDDSEIKGFLNSIHISNISSPSFSKTDFFGGVIDIFIETRKDGVIADIGFSIKSDLKAASTCFNASGDNTNFVYRLTGEMTDELMDKFNNTWTVKKDGSLKITPSGHYECDMMNRMKLLRDNGIDLEFVSPAGENARVNLIKSGGRELPAIVGSMLKYYYFVNTKSSIYINETIDWLVAQDPADYRLPLEDQKETYEIKVQKLLYDLSMGLRFKNRWNGKHDVSGGYIVVHNNGSITAYHTTVEDEFKGFLYRRLQLEKPSASRHKFMTIYKEGNDYFVKLNLQCRFNLERE